MESKQKDEHLLLNKLCQTKAQISETEIHLSNLVKMKDSLLEDRPRTTNIKDFRDSINNSGSLDMCVPFEQSKIFIKPEIEVLEIKSQESDTNIEIYIEDIKEEQNENCYSPHGRSNQDEFDIKIEPSEENDQFASIANIQDANYDSIPIKEDEMDIEIKYEDFKTENQNDNSISSDPKQPTEDVFFTPISVDNVDGSFPPLDGCNVRLRKKEKHIESKTETSEKPHKCEICLKSFWLRRNLLQHMKTHTSERPYECEICLKSFAFKTYLDRHMRVHSGEKPEQCEICLKRFSNIYQLREHTITHTGNKPFKCEICLKSFVRRRTLQYHMEIHTGKKLYECEICFRPFLRKHHCKSHMRTHTGEKPEKCEICLMRFSDRGTRNRHIKLHTGGKPQEDMKTPAAEQPYKCEICLEQFSSKSLLEMHKIMSSEEKLHECKICLKRFSHKRLLQEHMIIHTGNKTPMNVEVIKIFIHY